MHCTHFLLVAKNSFVCLTSFGKESTQHRVSRLAEFLTLKFLIFVCVPVTIVLLKQSGDNRAEREVYQ